MATYFSSKELLAPPTERAAFSDRQAYVCAELSKLAYFKFEGGHTMQQALEIVRNVLGDDERLVVLEQQLKNVLSSTPSTAAEGEAALNNILQSADFKLVKTFSIRGTQAFFCTKQVELPSGAEKTVAFLVYRGTEPKDFQDIKTDVRASLKEVTVGNETIEIHTGYYKAFTRVKGEIVNALNETHYDQLFITGHSLGGALAVVTTRILAPAGNGACYTFGAPPIGTVDVQNRLKTPVYQIINEVDIVPRLPNPWAVWVVYLLLRIIWGAAKSVTILNRLIADGSWDKKLDVFIVSMTKYRHPGYVSYLVGAGESARLRYNVYAWDRLKWWLEMMWKRRIWQFKKMVTDHSIDEYITKLKVHTLERQ